MSGIEALVGRKGEKPECKVFSEDVAMHRFPADAEVGMPCLCGKTFKKPERDIVQVQKESWERINERGHHAS